MTGHVAYPGSRAMTANRATTMSTAVWIALTVRAFQRAIEAPTNGQAR